MDKKILKEVKELCKPLSKLSPLLKAVWIYGSFIKKDKYEKTSDIDIMAIVDDTRPNYTQSFMKKLILYFKIIESKAQKKDIKLHFQPPKTITFLWEIIRNGEPWIITSFDRVHVLFDKQNFVKNTQFLIKDKEIFRNRYKTEKLAETAYQKFYEAKDILLKDIPLELFFIIVESAQGILSYYGRYPSSPKATLDDMKEVFKKHPNRRVFVEYFEELYMLIDKINRDVLVEFSGEDLDKTYKKITEFVLESESIISTLENKKRFEKLDRIFKECKELCIDALKKRKKKIPSKDKNILDNFKKEFIDSGSIEEYHFKTLKDIFDYNKKKQSIKPTSEEYNKIANKKIEMSYVKSLRLVLNDIIEGKDEKE